MYRPRSPITEIDAVLDTGASFTFLNLTDAQRTFNINVNAPDVEKVGEIRGGFSATMYRRHFKTLAFEGVTIAPSGFTEISPQYGLSITLDRQAIPASADPAHAYVVETYDIWGRGTRYRY